MPSRLTRRPLLTRGLIALGACAALSGGFAATSSGDLQSQISSGRSAAQSLRDQISNETSAIEATAGGLAAAETRLSALQTQLNGRIAQLRTVQGDLLASRTHLVELENRLRQSSAALAANLVRSYEGGKPDLTTVILQSHGFSDLLEQMSFLAKIGHQDATIVGFTRTARVAVFKEVTHLGNLEQRDRTLTEGILQQRNQVAALQGALLNRQIAQTSARSSDRSKLSGLNDKLGKLEAKAAAQARQSAAQVNRSVGGIAVDTGGMVQPPAGAPLAVQQVIAAGNAIASLPYIWGGGHGSFTASGYDCSGSISYALAAAGLLASPLTSGSFESWGEAGPGKWITVYANPEHAWMVVAGWRFDTVALATSGTRWAQGGGEFSGMVERHPPGL